MEPISVTIQDVLNSTSYVFWKMMYRPKRMLQHRVLNSRKVAAGVGDTVA